MRVWPIGAPTASTVLFLLDSRLLLLHPNAPVSLRVLSRPVSLFYAQCGVQKYLDPFDADCLAAPTKHITSSTASSTATVGSNTSSSSSSSISGGAIGGIVVGCVVAIIIVALIFLRKKVMACFGRKKPQLDDGSDKMPQQPELMAQSEPTWQPSEMPAEQNAIHEIGSTQATPPRPHVIHEIG